jgi:hypothetical protein
MLCGFTAISTTSAPAAAYAVAVGDLLGAVRRAGRADELLGRPRAGAQQSGQEGFAHPAGAEQGESWGVLVGHRRRA